MRIARGSLIALIAGVVAAAALLAAATVASAGTRQPPCTRQALAAGLKRGPMKGVEMRITGSFACAKGWAYSSVLVGSRAHGFEAVAVFKAERAGWVAVNRAKPCRTHAIPQKLYRGACTTS